MLPPKRHRDRGRFSCATCRALGMPHMLGRMTDLRDGQRVLYVRRGIGVMVCDAATPGEWIIVCRHEHATVFTGDVVIWKDVARPDPERTGEAA